MTELERDIYCKVIEFTKRMGYSPDTLYLGCSEYTNLLDQDDMHQISWTETERKYRGMTLFCVDVVSHLNVC